MKGCDKGQEQDDSAIHDWNRQQVEDAQVQADGGAQAEKRRPTLLLGGSARLLSDADRPRDGFQRGFVLNQFSN